jgi:hypothetical protein
VSHADHGINVPLNSQPSRTIDRPRPLSTISVPKSRKSWSWSPAAHDASSAGPPALVVRLWEITSVPGKPAKLSNSQPEPRVIDDHDPRSV